MLKMQSRPSQYSITPSSAALQRASYGSAAYPDVTAGCSTYYQSISQQQHNSASLLQQYNPACSTSYNPYTYYNEGVETTSSNPTGINSNDEPNSPNGSISSPIVTSDSHSPICKGQFSPNGSNTENTADTTSSNSTPPLQYDPHSYKHYSSYPQYTSTSNYSTVPNLYYTDSTTATNNATPGYAYYTNSSYAGGYNNPSSAGTSSIYSDYLHSGSPYSSPVTSVGGTHSNSSFALWNYPTLQVGQYSKVSYDTPRFKLTPERAIPLVKWFEEHKDHPYPSRHEKMALCQSTQLTFTQVSTWFANARRRMKKATHEDDDDDDSECISDEERQK